MTAHHYLSLVAIVMVTVGWGTGVNAEENVTIYGATAPSADASAASSSSTTGNSAGTTTHHRRHHKKTAVATDKTGTPAGAGTASTTDKNSTPAGQETSGAKPAGDHTADATAGTTPPVTKKSRHHHHAVAATNSAPASTPAADTAHTTIVVPAGPAPETAPLSPIVVTKPTTPSTPITISAPPAAPPPAVAGSDKPEVETGLPVAKPGSRYSVGGVGADPGTHSMYPASVFPLPPFVPVSSTLLSHKDNFDDFNFTNLEHRVHNVYPWKINIVTTEFWIGEGSTPISSTDNVSSAWDEDWRDSNRGTDSPYDRDGFATASHVPGINPFYVALPFNDLAFPDKARRWLPSSWYRPPRNGKPVSACKDRWVEIKNAQGDVCFAQWEDVGPLRYDHAEYVFGNDSPDTYTSAGLDRAGLDVSPAVAQYLNINERNRLTRWRFVDDADVLPGAWLKYDEETVLFKAIRDAKETSLPIERARAPITDPDDIDASQKKVDKAKG